MKILILVIFTFTSAFADVTIQDTNNVIIAGVNVGKLVDACTNHPQKRAEVQTALETYIAKLLAAPETNIAELLATKAAAEKSFANTQAEAKAAKEAAEKSLADIQAFTADLLKRVRAALEKKDLKQIEELIAEGETPARQRKREALRAEKERIEQQITELK